MRGQMVNVVVGIVGGCFILCGTSNAYAQRQMTLEEFHKAVSGKDKQGVIAAVGKPDSTQIINNEEHWLYTDRVIVDSNGKRYSNIDIKFREGFNGGVTFYNKQCSI